MNSPVTQLLIFAGLSALAPVAFANSPAESFEHVTHLKTSNPLDAPRTGAPIIIPVDLIKTTSVYGGDFYVEVDGQPTASQLIDTTGDNLHDALIVMADYAALATKPVTVTTLKSAALNLEHTPLTQTDMGVRVGGTFKDGVWKGGSYQQVNQLTNPASHTIGDKLYKYEGFGWESDRIGYRFYFDERGLIDIFSKSTPELVLHNVGLDGGNYHKLNDWGMDTLKVGPSLGLAGIAAWENDAIVPITDLQDLSVQLHNGALQSQAILTQSGWPLKGKAVNVERRFSINAHSHLTHTRVATNIDMQTMAIGLVKHGVDTITSSDPKSEWSYLATFGKQSFIKDQLGMVIFYKTQDLVTLTSDALNELVIVKMDDTLEFYFGSRWEKETTPITHKQQFIDYLEATRKALNNPITVSTAP